MKTAPGAEDESVGVGDNETSSTLASCGTVTVLWGSRVSFHMNKQEHPPYSLDAVAPASHSPLWLHAVARDSPLERSSASPASMSNTAT
jgi:hypothetical protein